MSSLKSVFAHLKTDKNMSITPITRQLPPTTTEPAPATQETRAATAAATAAVAASTAISRETVAQAVNDVRRNLEAVARNLQFSIDEDTGQTVVKVIDSDTHEVIRQIPSEELLKLAHAMDQYSGLFVQQKA